VKVPPHVVAGNDQTVDGAFERVESIERLKCTNDPESGAITCGSTCTYNTSACIPKSELSCGNGIVERQYGEECDGSAPGPSCTERGFWSGRLVCERWCRWSTAACHGCVEGGRGGIYCQ
jgi:hypothetical protein